MCFGLLDIIHASARVVYGTEELPVTTPPRLARKRERLAGSLALDTTTCGRTWQVPAYSYVATLRVAERQPCPRPRQVTLRDNSSRTGRKLCHYWKVNGLALGSPRTPSPYGENCGKYIAHDAAAYIESGLESACSA
jgi:hypothetical protein